MRKATVVVTLLALAVFAPAAIAASVHLKGGKNAEPTFTDNGLTLSVAGELSGLGNEDVRITLVAKGQPTATCGNPGANEHQAPGQNPAEVTLTGTDIILGPEIPKNGNTPFGPVTTDPPETPVAGAPDCPNDKWTETITDVAFTSAIVTVEQPIGTTVLTLSCTFSPATSDGVVPADDVSCTEV